jgi:hypothetical protein
MRTKIAIPEIRSNRQVFFCKVAYSRYDVSSKILQHVVPLLGNDCEISKYTTVVAKYRLRKEACFHELNNCTAKIE